MAISQALPASSTERDAGRDARICIACRSAKVVPLRNIIDHHAETGRRYSLGICRTCGTARLLDVLSAQQLEDLYPPTFYSYEVPIQRHAILRAVDRFRYDRHRFRPRFSRLLEIGSGCGEFMQTIRDRGEVVGLERSAAARAVALRTGLDVRVGDVGDPSFFEPHSFDYAYLSHSFEHLDDPEAALRSIHGWLTERGSVFLAVPNYGSILGRMFRRSWYNLAPPLHVTQFTPAGIRLLLERNGFEVRRIDYNSDPISIPMTVCFALGLSAHSLRRFQRLITVIALLCVPLSRLMDAMKLGDCIEVHACKRDGHPGEASIT